MMRICFFSREFPPDTHVGGIGTYTYNMAKALTNLGHTVHVITSTRESERSYYENGVCVHRIKNRRIIPKELWYFRYSYSLAKKINWIDCQFDIIQSSEFSSEAFWFALRKKYPLVTRLATPFFLAQELDGRSKLEPRPILNWMEKKQTLYSDGILTSSRALADAVTKRWKLKPSRVEVIPNSVDVSRVIRFGMRNLIPDILKNKEFLLYFGRLEVRKGILVLARTLPTVFEKFPNMIAVFIGADSRYHGSSMKKHIKKKLRNHQNKVIFFDNLSQEELFPIVNSAKIVVLPSLWEAFGFVCVEAMALGRPVIATSGSGFEEIIEDNVSGFLVKPGSSELLSDKIISCIMNGEMLKRISVAARKRAKDFEVSRLAPRLLNYYQRIKQEWLKKKGINAPK